jgi:hypothetical protein
MKIKKISCPGSAESLPLLQELLPFSSDVSLADKCPAYELEPSIETSRKKMPR